MVHYRDNLSEIKANFAAVDWRFLEFNQELANELTKGLIFYESMVFCDICLGGGSWQRVSSDPALAIGVIKNITLPRYKKVLRKLLKKGLVIVDGDGFLAVPESPFRIAKEAIQ